ncbi:MAG: metalloregulator ArsR/SmtB family transcription factor, partial [Desulfuromonadales bacterium]
MKDLARTCKAISDETRLRILAILTRGELCVCDLMAILDLPQSTVSRHLATLRHAGLVEDRRQGLW